MKLGLSEPVVEEDFKLLSKEEHAVWNKKHPEPAGGDNYERDLMRQLAARDRQLVKNLWESGKSEKMLMAWQTIVGRSFDDSKQHNLQATQEMLINKTTQEEIKWNLPSKVTSSDKLIIHLGEITEGKGSDLIRPVLFRQNRKGPTEKVANPREFAGYTHGYNHSRFARQVHDLLSVIAYLDSKQEKTIEVHAGKGFEAHAIVASYLAKDSIKKVVVESSDFRFSEIVDYRDPLFLPGAIKYGDLDFLIQSLDQKFKKS